MIYPFKINFQKSKYIKNKEITNRKKTIRIIRVIRVIIKVNYSKL
jgi:hypothetical protein